MVFNALIKSIKRKQARTSVRKTRKNTIKNAFAHDQHNHGVVNIHRIDQSNAGDYYCAPHHYFDKLKSTEVDIVDCQSNESEKRNQFIEDVSNNALIIGGGGLLNRSSFEFEIELFEKLTTKNKKTVLWGVGHNVQLSGTYKKVTNYNVDISKFGLVGVRDFSMPGKYVPCVSCLHPVFDSGYEETQEIGIVFHKKTMRNSGITDKFKHLPFTSNSADLEALVTFIGTHNTIITDSYHAMYWSMLLNKKVAVIPNSSKFYDFKYKPVFTSFDECLTDCKKAERYTGVLDECRALNLAFYDEVANYLNL
jgi:hypothetical protein